MSKKWKALELKTLKTLYLEKKSLKEMSNVLGRSITALNKALTRYNIRNKTFNFFCANSNISLENKKIEAQINSKRAKLFQEYKDDLAQWVNFNTVCSYLKKTGIVVVEKKDKQCFDINGSELTAMQVLMIANKNRIECKLPVYFVKDVSW